MSRNNSMSKQRKIATAITFAGWRIKATHEGGDYADITLNGRAVDVLNVSHLTEPVTHAWLRDHVTAWANENREVLTDYYASAAD